MPQIRNYPRASALTGDEIVLGEGGGTIGIPVSAITALAVVETNVGIGQLSDALAAPDGVERIGGAVGSDALAGALGGTLVGVTLPFADAQTQGLVAVLAGAPVNFTFFYKPTDGADWTPAYQRALNTGRNVYVPEGRWLRLKSATTKGQRIEGCGVTRSVWVIGDATHTFQDMAAQGVDITPGVLNDTEAGHHGIGFEFFQLNTNSRAQIIQYPWAIYMVQVDRPKLGDVRISNGWNGINVDGGGGMEAGVLEIGCFNTPFLIDRAYDTTTIKTLKFWPYGSGNEGSTTPLLYQVYQDGVALSKFGRVDGLSISLLATFQQRIQFYEADPTGLLFGTVGELHLDGTYGRLEYGSGGLAVGTWYGTTGSNTDFKILQSGGRLILGPCAVFLGPGDAGVTPLIQVSGGKLGMQCGGVFEALGTAQPLLSQTGGDVMWIGGQISGITNQVRTAPVFKQTAGRLTIRNVRFPDLGTGSGLAISIATDDNHDVQENALLGWGFSPPATISNGQYDFDRTIPCTPLVTFATPGNLAVAYATQIGQFRVSGNTVDFVIQLQVTPTFTTASGALRILTGIPYTPKSITGVVIQEMANISFSGQITAEIQTDGSILLRTLTSNAGMVNVGASNITSGTAGVMLFISGSYIV